MVLRAEALGPHKPPAAKGFYRNDFPWASASPLANTDTPRLAGGFGGTLEIQNRWSIWHSVWCWARIQKLSQPSYLVPSYKGGKEWLSTNQQVFIEFLNSWEDTYTSHHLHLNIIMAPSFASISASTSVNYILLPSTCGVLRRSKMAQW